MTLSSGDRALGNRCVCVLCCTYVSMIDTLAALSEAGMLSFAGALGVTKVCSVILLSREQSRRLGEWKRIRELRCTYTPLLHDKYLDMKSSLSHIPQDVMPWRVIRGRSCQGSPRTLCSPTCGGLLNISSLYSFILHDPDHEHPNNMQQ